MTQKTLKLFIDESYSKPPKKVYSANKTDVYQIVDIWSLDILDLKDFGPENDRGFKKILVVINNFSKFVWTVPLKNKNAQTLTNSFENVLKSSKTKTNLFETDRGKEFTSKLLEEITLNTILEKIY